MHSFLIQQCKRFIRHLAVFFIFFISATYITYPLIFNIGSLATGLEDELLISWIQNWVIHILTTNPLALFDANIYFPYHNALAFSDSNLVTSILSLIPLKLVGEPIVTQNFTLISSLILLGFSIYLLSYYLTKDYIVSLLTGFLVVFSPVVLDKYVHTQILTIYFVPLAILFIFKFLDNKKYWYLFLSLLCFILQTLNSFMPGYFIVFSYIIIFLVYCIFRREKLKKAFHLKTFVFFLISFVILIPFVLPYFKVSSEYQYTRDIRDAIHLSLQPEDFFNANNFTRLQGMLSFVQNKKSSPQNISYKTGFIGGVFSILFLLTIIYFLKRIRKMSLESLSLLLIAFVGLVLSLGPALHLHRVTIHHPFPIPLPYSLFYYILPGFQGFRNSARFEMLFIICIAVLVAIFLHQVLKKNRFGKLILGLSMIGVIIEYPFPMYLVQVSQKKDFPKIYSYINTLPQDVKIIEMPIFNWSMAPYKNQELLREYYSTIHFRKMVNGGSGFSPPPWQEMVTEMLRDFPSKKTLSTLQNIGVTHIIVHKKEYDQLYLDNFKVTNKRVGPGTEVINSLEKQKDLKLVKKVDEDFIYTFR